MLDLIAADGHRFEVNPKFWKTALYCAEEYGRWQPRYNPATGLFKRADTSEKLGESLMKLNPVQYEDLASFLIEHPQIKVVKSSQSCEK